MNSLEKDTFNTEEYVDKIVKGENNDYVRLNYKISFSIEIVTGTDLNEFKKKLVDERVETSSQIKSSVFKNYSQFIETAKEISRECKTTLKS